MTHYWSAHRMRKCDTWLLHFFVPVNCQTKSLLNIHCDWNNCSGCFTLLFQFRGFLFQNQRCDQSFYIISVLFQYILMRRFTMGYSMPNTFLPLEHCVYILSIPIKLNCFAVLGLHRHAKLQKFYAMTDLSSPQQMHHQWKQHRISQKYQHTYKEAFRAIYI